jgi:hypothetical protein
MVNGRCIDYPCCGHTDGLPCDYVPDYLYIERHAGCDHEAGYCQVAEALADADDDEETYDDAYTEFPPAVFEGRTA